MKARRSDTLAMGEGFTLVELSIVLVIIGLLAGAIVAGQDLIRAAEIRSVVNNLSQYTTAINAFQGKYGHLPGDMPDAESYWGSDANCPNTPSNTVYKTATCNGDGNGFVGYIYEDTATFVSPWEFFRAWQQLADAGMISGQYTGVTGPYTAYDVVPGVNAPMPRIKNGSWYIFSGEGTSNMWNYPFPPSLIIVFGSILDPVSYPNPGGPILTPKEELALDSKIDDGLPAQGRIIAQPPSSPYAPNCSTSDDPVLARYNTAYTDLACAFKEVIN